MKRQLLTLMMVLFLLFAAMPLQTQAVEDPSGFVYYVDANEAIITGYNGTDTVLYIPDTLDGHAVTGIAAKAFKDQSALTEVHFPDTLTSIARQAFRGCIGLTSVVIPEGVVSIDGWAFRGCSNLESVTLPTTWKTVYYADQYQSGVIGTTTKFESPFVDCPKLTKMEIPDGMVNLPSNVFNNMANLEEVILPDSLLTLGYEGFADCPKLTSIDFPESLTTIYGHAFRNCIGLTELEFPETLEVIERQAFRGCSALTDVVIPEGVTLIGGGAFAECNNLESVTLPTTWEEVSYYNPPGNGIVSTSATYLTPFYNCPKLKEITIPDGMMVLPKYAFQNMHSLEKVNFPDSLLDTGRNTFYGCTALTEVVLPDSLEVIGADAFNGCTALTDVVYPEYLMTINSNAFSGCHALTDPVFPEHLEYIGSGAYYNCTSIQNLVIPDTVTYLGSAAFYGCKNLEYARVSKYWEKVGETSAGGWVTTKGPFEECTKLTTVELPEGMTSIPGKAFQNTTSLQEIRIPDSVTSIGKYAFQNTGLKTVSIPEGMTLIDSYAFADCSTLEEVHLGEGIRILSDAIFSGCTSLKKIELPDSVVSIHISVFEGCTALSEVKFSPNLVYIGQESFANCDSLTEVHLPASVTTIEQKAFQDSDSLNTVTMTDSVKQLGSLAFDSCDALEHIRLSINLPKIPQYCFRECKALKEIIVPHYATAIEKDAFKGASKLEKVVISGHMTSIHESAFSYRNKTVLYGEPGSYVETWAEENNYQFAENTTLAESVTIHTDSLELQLDDTAQLQVQVEPLGFAGCLSFLSDDPDVVTVDESGLVTAVGPGQATVSVTVGESSANAVCTVHVTGELPHTHSYTAVVTKPTCTEQGYTTYTCQCGDSYQDDFVEATGHSYTAVVTEPTCTEQGYTTYTCQCGDSYQDEFVEATGHSFGPWKATGTAGEEKRTCENCGFEETRSTGNPVNPFIDVPAGAYYEAPVLWAVEQNVTSGIGNNMFGPDQSCLRSQVVTFLWRASGEPEPGSTWNPFVDVKESDYFYKAVLWAVEEGITTGMDATHFGYDKECTRGQVAAFLWRYAGKPEPYGIDPFLDVIASDFCYDAVLWAVENGVTKGMGDGIFAPNDPCTRAQIVTFLYRALA